MKNFKLLLVGALVLVSTYGCAQKQSANAQEAIRQSKMQASVQDQVDYLAGQAKAFINSKNFDQAITVANYILSSLDQNSQAAKDILGQAKTEMQKVARTAMSDMRNKLGNLGK